MRKGGITRFFSSQDGKLSIGTEKLPRLNLFYFDGASLEARQRQQLSDDFLSFLYKDESLFFVVCDGVGETTDAGIAARMLGKSLLDILPTALGRKKIVESSAERMRSIIDEEISRIPIQSNDEAPHFHLRARKEIGAQVKFACGVVDFKRGKVEIYWAGDIRFVIYDKNLTIIEHWQSDNNQFWSTKSDYSLDLDIISLDIKDVSRLSLTSDGIREEFAKILTKDAYLNDVNLVKHRYEDGVDDISGIDIRILPYEKESQLPQINDAELIDGYLNWTPVLGAEKYRIYFSVNDKIQEVAENVAKERSFAIPNDNIAGEYYIQAISSKKISSNLSNPVHYDSSFPTQNQNPIRGEMEPKPILVKPDLKQPMPFPEIQLNRYWKRFAIIFSILLLLLVGIKILKNILGPSVSTIVVDTPTSSVHIPSRTVNKTPSVSPTPTVTPSATLTGTLLTPSETPNYTATIEVALDTCQRRTMIDEPGKWEIYQVHIGDSFFGLALTYNTTVEELLRANCYQEPNDLNAEKYILIPVIKK